MRAFLTAFILAILVIPMADAQQRPMRDRVQPAQPGPNQSLSPAETPTRDGVHCTYIDVRMTIHGLAFFCRERNTSPWVDRVIVFDGGDRPGGLEAAMEVLLEYTRVYREDRSEDRPLLSVTFRDPDANSQRICDMTVRYGADITCHEMMSLTARF